MRLKNLEPGDEFVYLHANYDYREGRFLVLGSDSSYLQMSATKSSRFIFSFTTKKVVNHFEGEEVIKKEANVKSQNQMGHFIGWKFGVPVRVSSRNHLSSYTEGQVLLIEETENTFTVKFEYLVKTYNKKVYSYELIPYKYSDVMSPRYPVCLSPNRTAFCNSENNMTYLDTTTKPFYKYPTVKLVLEDGREIRLSAETTAILKAQLGV